MSDQNWNNSDDIIRITHEEAASEHVDDLLKRQMNLRGERAVSKDKRRWYLQNWFVFMIAGVLAAIAASAMIEPFFDDLLYIQGRIERIEPCAPAPSRLAAEQEQVLTEDCRGWVYINGQKIWFLRSTTALTPGGNRPLINSAPLKVGQEIGVFAEYAVIGGEEIGVAPYVRLSPPKDAPATAKMTLSQLSARSGAAGLLLFPLVAGLIGLAIGAVDGVVCRLARRALLGGTIGLFVGFVGGFISGIFAELVYAPLNALAMSQSANSYESLPTFAFVVQMIGRSLAWAFAGMAMGLGQGIAQKSGRLLLYGLVGGIIGGLLGGLLFDPIDFLVVGASAPSAHWSRLIGIAVIGAGVGLMIGIVELLARDAWLRMTVGPLAGKEFLIFKDVMNIGSSPRSDIYLFNDPAVAGSHAVLRASGGDCEIHGLSEDHPVLVNNRPVRQSKLRHGDQVAIGRTIFVFQQRQS